VVVKVTAVAVVAGAEEGERVLWLPYKNVAAVMAAAAVAEAGEGGRDFWLLYRVEMAPQVAIRVAIPTAAVVVAAVGAGRDSWQLFKVATNRRHRRQRVDAQGCLLRSSVLVAPLATHLWQRRPPPRSAPRSSRTSRCPALCARTAASRSTVQKP
jgi:hypothetical protein